MTSAPFAFAALLVRRETGAVDALPDGPTPCRKLAGSASNDDQI
jgi:hypothetical protein